MKNVREIPIHFAERTRGQSKLTLAEQFRYLEHLSRLYDFTFPRFSPIAKFLIVLTLSWLIGAAVARTLTDTVCFGHPGRATSVSYIAALMVEALFYRRYIRTQREFILSKNPWRTFAIISFVEWCVCTIVAFWTTHRVNQPNGFEIIFFAYGGATMARYVLRKELLQDVRGLRRDLRKEELTG